MSASATGVRRTLTVAAHEYRLLKQDPQSLIVLIGMPILIVVFLRGAFVSQLAEEGYGRANGSEQVVPGMAVTFSFFLIGFLGLSFFRERYWGTWERLRATELRRSELVLGKMIPPLTLGMVQAVVLFGLGITAFDLRVRGSLVALSLVSLLLLGTVASVGMFLVTVAKSFQQLNGFTNVAALLLAGVGGALAPLRELPQWIQEMAPVTPTYWAMRGFRSVILERGDVLDVLPVLIALSAYTVLFTTLCVRRIPSLDSKTIIW